MASTSQRRRARGACASYDAAMCVREREPPVYQQADQTAMHAGPASGHWIDTSRRRERKQETTACEGYHQHDKCRIIAGCYVVHVTGKPRADGAAD